MNICAGCNKGFSLQTQVKLYVCRRFPYYGVICKDIRQKKSYLHLYYIPHKQIFCTKFPLYTILNHLNFCRNTQFQLKNFKRISNYFFLFENKCVFETLYQAYMILYKVMHDLKFCTQSRLQFFLSTGSKTTTRANNIHQGTIGHFGFIIC